jgi:K+ transporter
VRATTATVSESRNANGQRRVGRLLMVGLIFAPILFVWFLLGRGYPNSTRAISLLWAAAIPVMGLIHSWGFYTR